STSHMQGWMRFREAPPVFDERHFVSLADSWPPAVIQMLAQPAPGSSMTWTLELLGDVTAEPDAHFAYAVHTDQAADGYAHTDARIWHPDGSLVAISRQTVSVFGCSGLGPLPPTPAAAGPCSAAGAAARAAPRR